LPGSFFLVGVSQKGSVNHYYRSVAHIEGACALAAFVSRYGDFADPNLHTQVGGNRVRIQTDRAGQWLITNRRKAQMAQKPFRSKRAN
jgi:hypothetical protein